MRGGYGVGRPLSDGAPPHTPPLEHLANLSSRAGPHLTHETNHSLSTTARVHVHQLFWDHQRSGTVRRVRNRSLCNCRLHEVSSSRAWVELCSNFLASQHLRPVWNRYIRPPVHTICLGQVTACPSTDGGFRASHDVSCVATSPKLTSHRSDCPPRSCRHMAQPLCFLRRAAKDTAFLFQMLLSCCTSHAPKHGGRRRTSRSRLVR